MQSFSPADPLIHNASKSLHFSSHSGLQCIFHQASEILSTLMIWYSLSKGIFELIYISRASSASPAGTKTSGNIFIWRVCLLKAYDWLWPGYRSIIRGGGRRSMDTFSINLIEIKEAQGGQLLLPLPSYFKSQPWFGRREQWEIEGWGRGRGRQRVNNVKAKVHSCAGNLMLRWKRRDTFFRSLHNFPTPPQKLKCCIFNAAVNNLHSMGKITPFVLRCQKFFFVKYKKVARC